MVIITLGYHCNITFLNQRLKIKKETGVFEWFESRKLSYITDVINCKLKNQNANVVKGEKPVYLLNRMIYSCHYNKNEYIPIFERRFKRFISNIKESTSVFFIRFNILNSITSVDEINNFIDAIRLINNNIRIKFLLIDTIRSNDKFNPIKINNIKNVEFYNYFFTNEEINGDVYCKKNNILDKYKNILTDCGFCMENEIYNIEFNDKSEI